MVILVGLLVLFLISQLDNEVCGKSSLLLEIMALLLVSVIGFVLFAAMPSIARPLVGWIYLALIPLCRCRTTPLCRTRLSPFS